MSTPIDDPASPPIRDELRCAVDDLPALRAALAAGFRFEGVLRKALRRGAETADVALFARVAGDPPGPVEPSFAALPEDGLTDGTVLLRQLLPSDARALHEDWADPTTVANSFTGTVPSLAEATAVAARGGLDWLTGATAPFVITDVASGKYAGSVRLRQAGPPGVGGIGYGVHPDFRGRGYAARALRLLAPWAFANGFARLELGAKADNVASQRAALAAGFERDAPRAARLRYPDGAYADEARFYLVNPSVARR